jgi:hypothetical protein
MNNVRQRFSLTKQDEPSARHYFLRKKTNQLSYFHKSLDPSATMVLLWRPTNVRDQNIIRPNDFNRRSPVSLCLDNS